MQMQLKSENESELFEEKMREFELKTEKLLDNLELDKNVKYRRILKQALLYYFKQNGKCGILSKELYPYIAKNEGSTSKAVESSIRWAIDVTLNKTMLIYDIIGEDALDRRGKIKMKKYFERFYEYLTKQ